MDVGVLRDCFSVILLSKALALCCCDTSSGRRRCLQAGEDFARAPYRANPCGVLGWGVSSGRYVRTSPEALDRASLSDTLRLFGLVGNLGHLEWASEAAVPDFRVPPMSSAEGSQPKAATPASRGAGVKGSG